MKHYHKGVWELKDYVETICVQPAYTREELDEIIKKYPKNLTPIGQDTLLFSWQNARSKKDWKEADIIRDLTPNFSGKTSWGKDRKWILSFMSEGAKQKRYDFEKKRIAMTFPEPPTKGDSYEIGELIKISVWNPDGFPPRGKTTNTKGRGTERRKKLLEKLGGV